MTDTLIQQELRSLRIVQQLAVNASQEKTFAAMIEQLTNGMAETSKQPTMNLKLEQWPGGRWYRDLGNNNGHLWGHVQVFKKPLLLEIVGPMFMSFAAASHLQIRVAPAEKGNGCLVSLRHEAIGFIPDAQLKGEHTVHEGWKQILEGIKSHAEEL